MRHCLRKLRLAQESIKSSYFKSSVICLFDLWSAHAPANGGPVFSGTFLVFTSKFKICTPWRVVPVDKERKKDLQNYQQNKLVGKEYIIENVPKI